MRRRTIDGTIAVITGCMFSGKTTELIRRLDSLSEAGYKVQAFKPLGDTRYARDQLVPHDSEGQRYPATPIPDNEPSRILAELKADVQVIGIDEVQFFGAEIVQVCEKLIAKSYQVIVAGLDTDFRRLPFGSTQDLVSLANELGGSVHPLEASCAVCNSPAYYSQRLVDGEPASFDDPVVKIGKDDYEPRCEKCHRIERRPSPSCNMRHDSGSCAPPKAPIVFDKLKEGHLAGF